MRDPRLVELDQLIKKDVPLLQKLVMKREAQKRARWQDVTIRRETRRKLYLMETERLGVSR